MSMLEKFLQKINGLHYRQEYLCTEAELLSQPLHLYLSKNGRAIKDITKHHCFVGYSPLVFALPASIGGSSENIRIVFTARTFNENETILKKDAQAVLTMKKIPSPATHPSTVFFEGFKGSHSFLHPFYRQVLHAANRLYGKKPGNVYLEGNLYDQVQIAYAIPRKICLITVGTAGLFNLFPTDLHGAGEGDLYFISLRKGGKACEQVIDAGEILLSEMEAAAYRTVYGLGKNHMQPLKPLPAFPFSASGSAGLGLPLPEGAVNYRELRLQSFFTHGIHQILQFSVTGTKKLNDRPTLSHVHNLYASWRYRRGLPGNYLMR